MNNFLRLLAAVAICEGAGLLGAIFTTPSIPTWYASLVKPSFNPPNWVFGPVWTTIYLLMGISLFVIWTTKEKSDKTKEIRRTGLYFFFIQLILNILWSIVFFGGHSLIGGLIIIIILWLSILETIKRFSKTNKTAAFLLYPYLVWVSFASILNFSIWWLNK